MARRRAAPALQAVLRARDAGAAGAGVSSPGDDERILEVAERIDGLSETESKAALAALAPSDRDKVVLTMLTKATMVEELTAVLVAELEPEAAERYAEALGTLGWRVLRIARAQARSEVQDAPDMQAAIDELVAAHPELEEHAEIVAVFVRARAS
jgi:hypothetical protein